MIKLEISNLPAFQKSLEKLETRIRENVEAALEKGANEVARGARNRVPVDTGALKESIAVKPGAEDLSFFVEAGAPHARFVEFGTLKTPARPFLVPALEERAGGVKFNIEKVFNQTLRGQA